LTPWTMTAAAAPTDNIVLYASDATVLNGNWARAAAPTAAGGQMLSGADKGWSAIKKPAPKPDDYVEFSFTASAGVPYRIWLRLRADGNLKDNDSVYAQFSDAVSASGATLYKIGGPNGLIVNLQTCDSCPLAGWGWTNSAYWETQDTTVKFAGGGTHVIRIQTREDGVAFDQVVLSPVTYFNSSPGQAQNDSTIVPKTTGSATPVPTTTPPPTGTPDLTSSTPFGPAAAALPGTIQPERFDNGGEGIAYHDATPENTGGAVRQTGVDIEARMGGGYDVAWTSDGEWLQYSVNVTTAGNYMAQFSIASAGSSGQFSATIGPSTIARTSVPNTGGWQAWSTVTVPVTLTAGAQMLRVSIDTGGFNLGPIVFAAPSPSPTGRTLTVNAGTSLQAALDAALPGDTLLLQAGATFIGNFVLPVKSGSDFITIRSAAPDSALPGPDVRMTPAYSAQLPKIKSPNTFTAMATAPGAHHYRIMFVEFLANVQGYGDILTLGDGDSEVQKTTASVPHDLIIDRVYMRGDPTFGQKRAIGLNSASTVIINSHIADIKANGQDSQAIGGWNGPGPFTISNNYLEAAGENILIGGSDPGITNLVPSDITITRNYLTKQLAWRTQTQWNVKNLLELKNAQRVKIDGNVLEYSWEAAQSGYAVVFTPRNQGGTAPWSVVQQVQFTNNVVRHVGSGINILGLDDEQTSQLTNHIVIRNNLFEDVSSKTWGGAGRMALVGGGSDITFDHNTVIQDGWTVLYAYGPAAPNFVFTNNIVPDYSWAIMGADTSAGNSTIRTYFPAGQFLKGVFAGGPSWSYPSGNYFPVSMANVGFVNLAGGNYRLGTTSPYRRAATDLTDVGCNIDALNVAAGTAY
jgi:hypothetical protein